MLSDARTALIVGQGLAMLRSAPYVTSPIVAKAQPRRCRASSRHASLNSARSHPAVKKAGSIEPESGEWTRVNSSTDGEDPANAIPPIGALSGDPSRPRSPTLPAQTGCTLWRAGFGSQTSFPPPAIASRVRPVSIPGRSSNGREIRMCCSSRFFSSRHISRTRSWAMRCAGRRACSAAIQAAVGGLMVSGVLAPWLPGRHRRRRRPAQALDRALRR